MSRSFSCPYMFFSLQLLFFITSSKVQSKIIPHQRRTFQCLKESCERTWAQVLTIPCSREHNFYVTGHVLSTTWSPLCLVIRRHEILSLEQWLWQKPHLQNVLKVCVGKHAEKSNSHVDRILSLLVNVAFVLNSLLHFTVTSFMGKACELWLMCVIELSFMTPLTAF